jgi:hypothetical protein
MRLPDATLSIFSCSNTLRFIAKRRVNRLPPLLRLCAVPSVCPLVAPRFGNVTEKAFSLSGEQLRNETNRPQADVSAIPGRRSLQANFEAFWRSSFIASRRARSRAARCRFGLSLRQKSRRQVGDIGRRAASVLSQQRPALGRGVRAQRARMCCCARATALSHALDHRKLEGLRLRHITMLATVAGRRHSLAVTTLIEQAAIGGRAVQN